MPLTVREVDLTPSYTTVNVIEVDQADGFKLSEPTAGVIRLDILPANQNVGGIVSTGAQMFAGTKQFNDIIVGGIVEAHNGVNLGPNAATLANNGSAGFVGYIGTRVATSGQWEYRLDATERTFRIGWEVGNLTTDLGGPTKYSIKEGILTFDGVDGTDAIGNIYHGGIINTVVSNAATARTNLGLGTIALAASGSYLAAANSLSDVSSPSTARTNLGLGTAATRDTGSTGSTIPLLDAVSNRFSGDVYALSTVAYNGTSNGYMQSVAGDASHTGFIQWFLAGGTRLGYMGFDTVDISLALENGAKFRVKDGHAILGTGDAPTDGGNEVLVFSQTTAPTTLGANTFVLYGKDVSGTCEGFAMDEAGTATQITPHNLGGPAWLYDENDMLPRVTYEENQFLGFRRWTNESRKAALMQRQFAGENIALLPEKQRTFIHEERFVPTIRWTDHQAALVVKRQQEIQAQALRKIKIEAMEKPFTEAILQEYTPKVEPEWLRLRRERMK